MDFSRNSEVYSENPDRRICPECQTISRHVSPANPAPSHPRTTWSLTHCSWTPVQDDAATCWPSTQLNPATSTQASNHSNPCLSPKLTHTSPLMRMKIHTSEGWPRKDQRNSRNFAKSSKLWRSEWSRECSSRTTNCRSFKKKKKQGVAKESTIHVFQRRNRVFLSSHASSRMPNIDSPSPIQYRTLENPNWKGLDIWRSWFPMSWIGCRIR